MPHSSSGHLQLQMHSASYGSSGVATRGLEPGEITGVAGQPAGCSADEEDVWRLTVKLAGLAGEVPAGLQTGSLWDQFQTQFSQVHLVRTPAHSATSTYLILSASRLIL